MKLKKIAALALAGVMAVSMLAGCGTNKPEEKPGEGEGEETTVTGYSALLEDAMKLDDDLAKYVSFADNATDQAALVKALGQLDDATLFDLANNKQALDLKIDGGANAKAVADELKDILETVKTVKTDCLNQRNWKDTNVTKSGVKTAAVYAINGGMSDEALMQQINTVIKSEVTTANLPDGNSDKAALDRDYTYVISASVVNKSLTDINSNGVASVNFVLVTITRNSTAA